jgi:hypothetical protein
MTKKFTPLRLLSSILILSCIYFITTSSSTGVTGASVSGCSCHGSANAVTSVSFSGIPSTGWTHGASYTITALVSNSSLSAAGFNLKVSAGGLSAAPANTSIVGGNEIKHTSPKSFVSGVTSWTFTWTAPTSTAITSMTMTMAGLAVNLDGNSTGDKYNLSSATYTSVAPVATAPTISINNISAGITNAIVNGIANANNASTVLTAEYGLTTAYGSAANAVPATAMGNNNTNLSVMLIGLAPGTMYHVRLKAVNSAGTTFTADSMFTTLLNVMMPTIVSSGSSNITSSGALINASVNANNGSTTIAVKYGTTIAYGNSMNTTPSSVSGNSATAVSAVLTGLTAGTLYHYKVETINSAGTVSTNDATFTTLNPASLQDVGKMNVSVYPNPSQDFLFIKNVVGLKPIAIIANNGQFMPLLFNANGINSTSIDVRQLPIGNYTIVFELNAKRYVSKFSKN